MPRPDLKRRILGLAAASALFATGPALAQTRPPAPDPVQTTWEWLQDAPVAENASLAMRAGPGLAALDAVLPEIDTAPEADLIRLGIAARLGSQLARLPLETRLPLVAFLREHEELAADLSLQILPDDDTAAAYGVLARLIEAHGELVAENPALAAAFCVVHDQPRPRRINENTVPLIDAVELFGYFVENKRSMRFDFEDTPASLLIFIADANGSLEQLEWARRRYGRDRDLGDRYREITYDTDALRTEGAEKKVTAAGGYSLQTILEYGGICADQAYYAMTVGKASGVPGCYVRGQGGEVSHAWLGFLERSGRNNARWNFEAGRYAAYEDVRGTVLEPQTWTDVPDANLGIAGYSTWIKPEARQLSVVLTDAVLRQGIQAWMDSGQDSINAELADRQLELLERALREDPGNVRAWLLARARLARPGLSLSTRERWAREIDLLAGQASPDFAYDMLQPMFDAEPEPMIRYNLWDWAVSRFGSRQDLPAMARMAQVRILLAQNKPGDAYEMARSTFGKYHQGGPAALEALQTAEELLAEHGGAEDVLELYEWAFQQPRQPKPMKAVFLRQTAWFKVGSRYADLLDAAGEARKAAAVRKRLGL